MIETGLVEAAAFADPSPEMSMAAKAMAPQAEVYTDLEDLLRRDLDGIVIATPSAQHAAQAIRALDAGLAVFCQKPLGRNAQEVADVVEAARRNDRLLCVDLSYRETDAMRQIRHLIGNGELGDMFAVNMIFHNAYGPDKPWFYDRNASGGGCLMDLGVHLVDLALFALDFPKVAHVSGQLFAKGKPIGGSSDMVEDFAVATIVLEQGSIVTVSCSWNLHAGRDAVIQAEFYGTEGGASLFNLKGSFYALTGERFSGTSREALCAPQTDWGARAAVSFVSQLAQSKAFSEDCEKLVAAASVIDGIYLASEAMSLAHDLPPLV